MRIFTIILRVLLGLLFLFASVSFFLNLAPPPKMEGQQKIFMDGIMASGYLMQLVKITELVCALALITGFFVPLALIMLLPVTINILLTHIFVMPDGIPMAIAIIAVHLFLLYQNRQHYAQLFRPRT